MQPLFSLDQPKEGSIFDSSDFLYRNPPYQVIKLSEIEELAAERSEFLHKVENLASDYKKHSPEYDSKLLATIKEYRNSLKNKYGDVSIYDNIAHYLLRLAFAKSLLQRNWLVNQETEIFRISIVKGLFNKTSQILSILGVDFQEIPADSIPLLSLSSNQINPERTVFKLRFEDALDAVRSRSGILHKGWIILKQEDMDRIVIDSFRTFLQMECAKMVQRVKNVEEDDRLLPRFAKILDQNQSSRPLKPGPKNIANINADSVESFVDLSFPPCMQNMHAHLKKTNHLKHQGRIQYGLFLKGIGLNLDESMKFWKQIMAKDIGPEKFDKLYAYYIRYNYGLEGKKCDFGPPSCMKVIMNNPNSIEEVHGCPFKIFDAKRLENWLKCRKFSTGDVAQVVDLATNSHYQIACARFFEITHNKPKDTVAIQSPIQYFHQSCQILIEKKS